jgi:hypothetical protein
MTKGTKIFAVIISIIFALAIAWGTFLSIGFLFFGRTYIHNSQYDVWVAGVSVTRMNKDDILGNGTVSYNPSTKTLIFDNAVIECEGSAVAAETDIRIALIGKNKVVCKNSDYVSAIYAAEENINHDISIVGDGSLTLEIQNISDSAQGIVADDLTISADITITTGNCENILNGIVCGSSLLVVNGANVTVNNGAAKNSSAVRVRGNAFFEDGTSMTVISGSGTEDTCKGFSVNGDLVLVKSAILNVSIDDEAAKTGECIHVTGSFDIGTGANVTASAKKTYAIECFGSVKANAGATVTAQSESDVPDIFCYGAFVNYGAAVNGNVDALCGVHERDMD